MVTNGVFSVHLGSITPITGVAFNRDHYLGITIAAEPELSPRTKLTPTPYSFMAMDVMNNTVNSDKIVNLSITGTDIANNTIGPEKLNFTITGTIGGSGAANYLPVFTNANTLGNSLIYQTGGKVGIGTTTPAYPLQVLSDSYLHVVHGEYTGTNNVDRIGVYGESTPADNWGIGGQFVGGYKGVEGVVNSTLTASSNYYGVIGSVSGTTANEKRAVFGTAGGAGTYNIGIYGYAAGATTNFAGFFSGNVSVTGTLSKGGGSFKIDHPLDPQNKYLYHSFVESPDMMNIYNGNIVTDGSGYATIQLPEWFEALNKDFRYQLTVIGDFAQAIVSQEVQNNQFAIKTDKPNIKVSWQVTGIRKDAFAEKNRIPVEEIKQGADVGKYIHPDAFGLPESMGIDYERNHPELDKTSK
jgi:hypothetical protein